MFLFFFIKWGTHRTHIQHQVDATRSWDDDEKFDGHFVEARDPKVKVLKRHDGLLKTYNEVKGI